MTTDPRTEHTDPRPHRYYYGDADGNEHSFECDGMPSDCRICHPPIKPRTEHTPGPWWTISDPLVASDGHWIYTVVSGAVSPIAMTELWTFEHRAEIEANFRLIAAAPDLLAALERIHNFSPRTCENAPRCTHSRCEATDMAERAIERARGEQP